MTTSTTTPQGLVQLFSRYLKDQGLPLTQQREAVASVAFDSEELLSAEDIEGLLRGEGHRIGKATIYRTLDLLVKSNLVAEHDFGEGFKRYDHRLSRHHAHQHLICQGCGKVTGLEIPEMPAIEARVARERGFKPVRHRLEIYGLCADCQARGVSLSQDGLGCPIDVI